MTYLALATDYDGTIAHDGIVDAATIDALAALRRSGRRIILVTGRELEELLVLHRRMELFDRVVAENGARLYHPDTGEARDLAQPPPQALIDEVMARGVPLSVGRSILATVEPFEHQVLSAIHDLGLEWHVIFNKGSVMALPSGVTKATGLTVVLQELDIPPERVVGVGDAENDHAFLRMCGLSVAVANALPALKDAADLVTTGARGNGVRELIAQMLSNDLAAIAPRPEHHEPAAVPVSG